MDLAARAANWLTTALLVWGVVLWTRQPSGDRADLVLNAGLVVLMATPVARLLSAIAQEIAAREWGFTALGLMVLMLLGGSVAIGFF